MTKKTRVLEIVDSIQYGGVEQFVFNIIKNSDSSKFEYDIISMGKKYSKAEERFKKIGVNIYNIPTKKENIFKHVLDINKIIKNGKYDVVHANINFWSFIPLFIAKFHKVNLKIAHVHGIITSSLLIKIYSWLTIKSSNIRLACSYEAGKSVYNKSSFEVIHNGIDVNKFKFDNKTRIEIRKKFNILPNEFVIGHIGRFYPVKNHEFIIQLFMQFKKENKNSKLILIGDGDLYEECKNKVLVNNLQDSIIFLTSQNNIQEYYNAFDTFILPSKSEGFGIVALEAQCNGLKCIVSTGVPEEINICNCVKRISINNINDWLSELKRIKEENSRLLDNFEIIKHSKYNIENSYLKVIDIYISKK